MNKITDLAAFRKKKNKEAKEKARTKANITGNISVDMIIDKYYSDGITLSDDKYFGDKTAYQNYLKAINKDLTNMFIKGTNYSDPEE